MYKIEINRDPVISLVIFLTKSLVLRFYSQWRCFFCCCCWFGSGCLGGFCRVNCQAIHKCQRVLHEKW